MKKQPTQHALAAKAIRAEIKPLLTNKARVKSSSFSGGTSIDVFLSNESEEVVEKVKDLCEKYEYGHFDGMTDCYEYSNTRDDLPQVKYLFVSNQAA